MLGSGIGASLQTAIRVLGIHLRLGHKYLRPRLTLSMYLCDGKASQNKPGIIRFQNVRGLHSGRPLSSGLHGFSRATLPHQSSSSREPLLGGTFEHAVSGILEADKQAIQVAGLADCFSRHGFGWEDGDGWLPGREAHYSRESLGACAKISGLLDRGRQVTAGWKYLAGGSEVPDSYAQTTR